MICHCIQEIILLYFLSQNMKDDFSGACSEWQRRWRKKCYQCFSQWERKDELWSLCYFRDSQVHNIHLMMFTESKYIDFAFYTKIKNPASTYKCLTWGSFILVVPLREVKFACKSDHLRSRTYSRQIRGTTFFPPKFLVSIQNIDIWIGGFTFPFPKCNA